MFNYINTVPYGYLTEAICNDTLLLKDNGVDGYTYYLVR